jgi:hypothetical protein
MISLLHAIGNYLPRPREIGMALIALGIGIMALEYYIAITIGSWTWEDKLPLVPLMLGLFILGYISIVLGIVIRRRWP